MMTGSVSGAPLTPATTLFASMESALKSPIPTTISKTEEEETIDMIKKFKNEGPSILDPFAEDEAQCKKLLKYMNGIRKTEKELDPLEMPKKQNKT